MKKEKDFFLFGIIIVCLLSILLAILKFDVNALIFSNEVNGDFLSRFSYIDAVFAFLTPTFFIIFLTITSSLMLTLFNANNRVKALLCYLPICFLPALISTAFSYLVLTHLDYSQLNMLHKRNGISLTQIKGLFSISLYDLKIVSYLAYLFVYIGMIVIFYKLYKIPMIKSVIISIAPTLIVVVIKYLI